jgi:TonB family protein
MARALVSFVLRELTTAPPSAALVGPVMIAATLVAAPSSVAGQNPAHPGSTLSGVVIDEMGGYVPKVTVVLKGVQQKERKSKTNATGRYEFVGLPPGDYVLEAVERGFRREPEKVTTAAADVQHDVVLHLGILRESVVTLTRIQPDSARDSGPAKVPQPPTCTPPTVAGGIGGRVRPPLKLRDVRPQYPERLERERRAGTVIISGTVNEQGRTMNLQVRNTAHADLSQAALDAVARWEFAPVYLNCVAVPIQLVVTFYFGWTPPNAR